MHKAASKQGALALRPLTPPQRPAMAGPHLSLRLSDPITQHRRPRIAQTDITTPQPQSLRPHGYNAPRRKRGEVASCRVCEVPISGTRARRFRTGKQSREPIEHARPIAKPDQSPSARPAVRRTTTQPEGLQTSARTRRATLGAPPYSETPAETRRHNPARSAASGAHPAPIQQPNVFGMPPQRRRRRSGTRGGGCLWQGFRSFQGFPTPRAKKGKTGKYTKMVGFACV